MLVCVCVCIRVGNESFPDFKMLVTMYCLEPRDPCCAFHSPAFEKSLTGFLQMECHRKERDCFRSSAPLTTYADNVVVSAYLKHLGKNSHCFD